MNLLNKIKNWFKIIFDFSWICNFGPCNRKDNE